MTTGRYDQGGSGDEPADMEVSRILRSMVRIRMGRRARFLVSPLLWLAVIVGLVFVFRRGSWDRRHAGSGRAVLAERYARGEITEEEYRPRVNVLRGRTR